MDQMTQTEFNAYIIHEIIELKLRVTNLETVVNKQEEIITQLKNAIIANTNDCVQALRGMVS